MRGTTKITCEILTPQEAVARRISIAHYVERLTSASSVAYYDVTTGSSAGGPGQGIVALSNDRWYSRFEVREAMFEQGLA